MFSQSAAWYDAIYEFIDYPAHAAAVLAAARAVTPDAASLLDVACGTARHLELLAAELPDRAGVDLEPGMLEVARRRCPDVPFYQADMRDFDLGRRFDVVTCLFSSIGYVGTTGGLRQAVASMARHLNPGGVLVVEPWLQPDAWRDNIRQVKVAEQDDTTIVRLVASRRQGSLSILDMHYLVGEDGRVVHRAERHELALFTWAQYVEAFAAAGLDATVDQRGPLGRGLVTGTRRAGPAV